jgi:hypothetical protein
MRTICIKLEIERRQECDKDLDVKAHGFAMYICLQICHLLDYG